MGKMKKNKGKKATLAKALQQCVEDEQPEQPSQSIDSEQETSYTANEIEELEYTVWAMKEYIQYLQTITESSYLARAVEDPYFGLHLVEDADVLIEKYKETGVPGDKPVKKTHSNQGYNGNN